MTDTNTSRVAQTAFVDGARLPRAHWLRRVGRAALRPAGRAVARGLLLLAALAALPLGATSLAAQAPGSRAILPGYDTPILLDTLGIAQPIHGARDSIFAAISAVFAELKIPVEASNAGAGMLRNLNAQISRRLGGEPLSRYLDCGRGFSGSNADIYRISLAISVWVEPATGDAERLLVAIAASGRDPSGSHSAYAVCTSRGALERRIAAMVQARLDHK